MRIALSESCLPDHSRADALALTTELGLAGLELVAGDARALAELGDQARADELRQSARAAGVAICGIDLRVNCATDGLIHAGAQTKAALEQVRQGLAVAKHLGAPVLLLPFYQQASIETEPELNTLCDHLGELGERADELGLTIGVQSVLSLGQKLYLLDHTGGVGVRIDYDTANAHLRRLDPAIEIRDLGAERIAQVHMRDVIAREGQPPELNLLLGAGQVDLPAIGRSLQAIGYDRWVCLSAPPVGDPVEAARHNVGFARKVLTG